MQRENDPVENDLIEIKNLVGTDPRVCPPLVETPNLGVSSCLRIVQDAQFGRLYFCSFLNTLAITCYLSAFSNMV